MEKVIGGEYAFLDVVKGGSKRSTFFDGYQMYASGRAALYQILLHLKKEGRVEKAYLPDWLCDSVYHVCEVLNIPYTFYHVKDDLRIDFSCLERLGLRTGGGVLLWS